MGSDDKISPGVGDGHNHSAQLDVNINSDPVLQFSNEHHHEHLHHGSTAVSEEKNEVMFANSTEKYTGKAGSVNSKMHQISSNEDEEIGRVGEIRNEEETVGSNRWSLKSIYRKYRLIFHLVIWAVWTA